MTHVKLYWNHICILHKQEKDMLTALRRQLLTEDIDLEVRYFGLGYPQHMSEYLADEDAELPDIIVSADLEVFELSSIFDRLKAELYPAEGWLPLRESAALSCIRKDQTLLPFASIPLVYYTRRPEAVEGRSITEIDNLAFGGINNSAGKTIAKAVWERYGREAAQRLLADSSVSDMPINAFQQVRMGMAQTALVPSLYALRADGRNTFLRTPQEGPVLVSSYICARKSIPESIARRVIDGIVSHQLCDFYAQNGDLIIHPNRTALRSRQECSRYFVPGAKWLAAYNQHDFYNIYCRALDTAHALA